MKVGVRSRNGQGLVEAIAAAFILIPIALFLLDIMVLVTANSMNDTAAKNAARAAANQGDSASALQAAQKSLQSFHSNAIVTSIALDNFNYSASKDGVAVQTRMEVQLPVPFPGYSHMTFLAKDIEPIVN